MAEQPNTSAAVPVATQDAQTITAGQLNAALAAAEARVLSQVTGLIQDALSGGASEGAGGGLGAAAGDLATALADTPFAVRYDFDREEFVMSLPEKSVTIDGVDVTPEDPGGLDEGVWYLNIKFPKSRNAQDAEPAELSQDEDSECDLSIPIVEIDEMGVKMQYVQGALHLARGGGMVGCFQPEYGDDGSLTGDVINPYVMAGRRVLEATGTIGEGMWGVEVDHSSDGPSAKIVSIDDPVQENTDTKKTVIPLYEIEDDQIVADYRGMPVVPLYDPKRS